MRRSTLVFIFFGLIFATLVAANYVATSQPPIILRVAVDPLVEAWVSRAALAFNAQDTTISGARVSISVVKQTEAEALAWTPTTRHDGWIAASRLFEPSFNPSQPFRPLAESLAETVLVWGGWQEYVQAITQDGLTFDWQAVQAAAKVETWERFGMSALRGNVFLGLPPASTSSGYAALLSAAASYSQLDNVRRDVVGSVAFSEWFAPLKLAVGRPNVSLISTLATQGAKRINFALLTEAEWLTNLNAFQDKLVYAYPAYNVRLDFPFYIWDDANTTPTQRDSLRAFADFLRREEQQRLLATYGLRRPGGQADASDATFRQGQAYGFSAELPRMTFISTPDRTTADSVIRLLN
ncbi:MAG: substrate-binding domain-containing protein [Anaerolineae bacterium]|nr:substrate-binding domain-containing protein [Anaerolineae bacterium]MDW8173424.1 substrate-binding domain-containing protein [Anaerolineae bacterium]